MKGAFLRAQNTQEGILSECQTFLEEYVQHMDIFDRVFKIYQLHD